MNLLRSTSLSTEKHPQLTNIKEETNIKFGKTFVQFLLYT